MMNRSGEGSGCEKGIIETRISVNGINEKGISHASSSASIQVVVATTTMDCETPITACEKGISEKGISEKGISEKGISHASSM